MNDESSPLLKVTDLSVQYPSKGKVSTKALDNVSFEIPKAGYSLAIVGESGSGKTTIGMSILKLIPAPGRIISGSVKFGGTNVLEMDTSGLLHYRGEQAAMVYQSAMNSLNPVKTILSHIEEELVEHKHMRVNEARKIALESLVSVGIPADRALSYSHELSGGMRQRVVIAMALALSPALLIADEPTSALDVVVQQQILELIKDEIKRRQLALIFITHDIAVVSNVAENIAVMYAGEIVEIGPTDKVLSAPVHPYTQMLIESLLTLETAVTISDSDIANLSLDSRKAISDIGCKFSNRCKYAFERCKVESPKLARKQGQQQEEKWLVACHMNDRGAQ